MVHHYRQSGVATIVAAAMLVPLTLTSCAKPDDPVPAKQGGNSSPVAADDDSERRFKAAVDKPSPSGPIVAVGHGAILLPAGEFVAPTPGLVRSAQRYYIDRLRAEATPEVRESFDAYRRSIEVPPSSPREFTINGDLVFYLIERVRPADAGRLRSINRFLVQAPRLFVTTAKLTSLKQALAPEEEETLTTEEEPATEEQEPDSNDDEAVVVVTEQPESLDAGSPVIAPDPQVAVEDGADDVEPELEEETVEPTVEPEDEAALAAREAARRARAAAYGEQCRAAGVPTPPPWNDPRWESQGELTGEFTLSERYTEVFRYVSTAPEPEGVCFALPRSKDATSSGEVYLLGIICQAKETSRSCFWDNDQSKTIKWEKDKPRPLPAAAHLPIDEYFEGATGAIQMCTDCHRGENAFIIHPASPLNNGVTSSGKNPVLQAKGWVTPIVPVDWHANRKPAAALESGLLGAGTCATCHSKREQRRFGELSGGYCGIMANAVNGNVAEKASPTMPSAPYARYADADVALKDEHWKLIKELCEKTEVVSSRSFQSPTVQSAISIGANDTALSGDFDYNGRADLAYVTAAGEVMVSLANAAQLAAPTPALTLPTGVAGLAAGDFNGDGADDLAIVREATVDKSGAIEVALGRIGQSAFGSPASWSARAASSVEHIVAADFDNDRRDDVMVFTGDGMVTLHLSDGRQFADKGAVQIGYEAGQHVPLARDIDGDSFADLALVPKSKDGELVLAFGRFMQVGTFEREMGPGGISLEEMSSVRLADVDGDGLGDLIGVHSGGVVVARYAAKDELDADAPYAFEELTSWLTLTGLSNALADDVNADGYADLITYGEGSSVQVGLSQTTAITGPPVATE